MSAADKQLITLSDQTTSLTSPKGMVDFAGILKAVIVEQGLYTNIKGKNYVHVEAWQFAGAAMGVIAIVKSTERIPTTIAKEYNYRAEVELRRLENDQLVGSGIAFCSNAEYSKKSFDEYAVASMAQTRATSKAYRIAFGWLMKMAGYEATPHEEMDGIDTKPKDSVDNKAVFEANKPTPKTAESMDNAAPTDAQFEEISKLAKRVGYSGADIANKLMLIDTRAMADKTIAKLKAGL